MIRMICCASSRIFCKIFDTIFIRILGWGWYLCCASSRIFGPHTHTCPVPPNLECGRKNVNVLNWEFVEERKTTNRHSTLCSHTPGDSSQPSLAVRFPDRKCADFYFAEWQICIISGWVVPTFFWDYELGGGYWVEARWVGGSRLSAG